MIAKLERTLSIQHKNTKTKHRTNGSNYKQLNQQQKNHALERIAAYDTGGGGLNAM